MYASGALKFFHCRINKRAYLCSTPPPMALMRPLDGLTVLSQELAENSGITDPFGNWLDSWVPGFTLLTGPVILFD